MKKTKLFSLLLAVSGGREAIKKDSRTVATHKTVPTTN